VNKKLKAYKQKSDFSATSEPKSGTSRKRMQKHHFVIQKHAASHLHYDFRLEMEGVLKSWAIPKGPSLNPKEKRLAIQTEDHPLEYENFEGIIPEGHYGAGTVLVWDRGYYENASENPSLLENLKKGHLLISLHGKKLKGAYIIQRIKEKVQSQWLFIKVKDQYADSTINITKNARSVASGKTLKEIKEFSMIREKK
jgi:bifunctional non-homologous end joining protein LigD